MFFRNLLRKLTRLDCKLLTLFIYFTECVCSILGTDREAGYCDKSTGQCHCLKNVIGVQCDTCMENHWKIASGEGCEPCDCDPLGSHEHQCNSVRIGKNSVEINKNLFHFCSLMGSVIAGRDLEVVDVVNACKITGAIRMLNVIVRYFNQISFSDNLIKISFLFSL